MDNIDLKRILCNHYQLDAQSTELTISAKVDHGGVSYIGIELAGNKIETEEKEMDIDERIADLLAVLKTKPTYHHTYPENTS